MLHEETLFGKFTGISLNPLVVQAWVSDNWGCSIIMFYCDRGFFLFIFERPNFRSCPYFVMVYGHVGLVSSRWSLDFDLEITDAPV